MGSMMRRGDSQFREQSQARRKFKEISIHKAKNRGRIVTHHFETDPDHPMLTPEPEHHAFGSSEEERKRLAEHLGKHMGIPVEDKSGAEGEDPNEEAEAEAGKDAEAEYAATPND